MKKIIANDGHVLNRVSRWIKIRQNFRPNRRNSLWYYVMDGNGHREGQSDYDPSTGLFLDYFIWNGRKWALEQFIALGGMMGGTPIFFENEDGKTSYIAGYDSENYYNPILIEFGDGYDYVRVYEEVHE